MHAANIEAVLGREDDPALAPGTFDAVLISNAYHEIGKHADVLKAIREALNPDGRLVLLENYSYSHRREERAAQAEHHDLSPDILERELVAAGFTIKERIDPILSDVDSSRYLFRAEKSK